MNPGLRQGSGRWLLLLGTLGRCQRAISLEIPLRAGPSGVTSPPQLSQVPAEGAPLPCLAGALRAPALLSRVHPGH